MYRYGKLAQGAHRTQTEEQSDQIKSNKQKTLGQSQVRRCHGCLSAVCYFVFILSKSFNEIVLCCCCYTTTISLNLFKDSTYGVNK